MTDNRMKALWWGIILLLVVVAGVSAAALGLDTLYRTARAPLSPQTLVPDHTLPPPIATATRTPTATRPASTPTWTPYPTPTEIEVDPLIFLWEVRFIDLRLIFLQGRQ